MFVCLLLSQLALQMKEVNREVEISWRVLDLDSVDLQLTPGFAQVYSLIKPLEKEKIMIKHGSHCLFFICKSQ